MIRFAWLLPLLCFAWLLTPAQIQAQDIFYRPSLQARDIEPTLRTEWFGLYLQGKKVGYNKTSRFRDGDMIVDASSLTMKLLSFGKKAEMIIAQTMYFDNTPPYRLVRALYEEDAGGARQSISIKRHKDGFEYTVAAAGQTQTRQVEDLDFTLIDTAAEEYWLRGGPKVGDEILTKDLNLKTWSADQNRSKVLAIKKSLVSGVDVKFYEVQSESKKEMITVLTRHDSEGRSISGNVAIFELRLESEEQAKNIEFSRDLFVLGMVKVDKKIARSTTELRELVVEVQGKEGDVFEEGPRQTVIEQDGGNSRLIKVGKKYGKEVKITAKELEENLAETTAYAISNARVKALAEQAVGNAKTPEEKVRRIVAFVHDYIKPHLTAALPNIHDLLEKKQGDCKCYALMTGNLCRAAGIPAREVSGLLYMGDDTKAFGGHAWNEVALNGVWVPVDASLNQVEVDAGHVFFGSESRATKNLLNSLGKLSFKVIDVQTGN